MEGVWRAQPGRTVVLRVLGDVVKVYMNLGVKTAELDVVLVLAAELEQSPWQSATWTHGFLNLGALDDIEHKPQRWHQRASVLEGCQSRCLGPKRG